MSTRWYNEDPFLQLYNLWQGNEYQDSFLFKPECTSSYPHSIRKSTQELDRTDFQEKERYLYGRRTLVSFVKRKICQRGKVVIETTATTDLLHPCRSHPILHRRLDTNQSSLNLYLYIQTYVGMYIIYIRIFYRTPSSHEGTDKFSLVDEHNLYQTGDLIGPILTVKEVPP